MRLGQLARKLAVRPAEIVDFLATSNIRIDDGTNARLDDEYVVRVIQHFAPARLEEIMQPAVEEVQEVVSDKNIIEINNLEPEAAIETVVVEPEPVIIPSLQEEIQSAPAETKIIVADVQEDDKTEVIEDKTEVIKAPKVELAGLKVLGKIELPEPKKKEIAKLPEEETSATPEDKVQEPAPVRPTRNRSEGRKNYTSERRSQQPRRNPIALQREHEAREAELKREEEAKREKERRTLYYQQRVKASVPTKPARLIDEPVMQMTSDHLDKTPTTWLGKFWKWFRS
ncbi:hypothetical protein [Ohtaekwangia koreensis]|uniref:Translation initiation factor IF-2, N-terminal region n=1 Tax=Ohtaekwangia koreensis TaxID=688867 RepID=A0A1T5M273_9BACT|nr:hypothetical protein [Ohtaekwangia koreensis]SKC82352.1 hypothetical protein SAMN05660236_4156 [Ohtaekwangia koreensis]